MKLSRKCPVCGLTYSKELPVDQEQIDRWTNGELAQDIWPELSADDREFIISGIHGFCWEKLYGDE